MTPVTEAAEPRGRQAERRATTRAKVLRAAARVFAARGFHGATLDEVAERAGVSKGAVYYNFDSKDDLFVSLLEERYEARLRDARAALSKDGGHDASAAGRGFLERLQRDPRWPPLFFEFVAYAAREPKVRARFGEWFAEMRATLAELVAARAEQLGVEPALPADELARAIGALANGMLIESLFDPDGGQADALDGLIALLMGARR